MALTETLDLNVQEAQRQIAALEAQLNSLSQPIDVPVSVTGEQQLAQVRQELGLSESAADGLNRELASTDDELRNVGREGKRAGDDLESAGRRGTQGFAGMRGALLGVAGAISAIAAIRGAFNFASEAITSASDLEQSIGALDAVFGDLGGTVAAFGEVADQSVGLAASQFNQLASLLGSQLQTFGFNVSDAADETQRLIVLASDLAATFGGPVSQAVEAISSLLRGEVNPIERYGVAMNQTLINAKALELGLATSTSEIDLQAKAMSALAILTEQTANAQGQFAREAETTAGQLERIRADFENFRAEAGEALVPAFQALLDMVPEIVDVLRNSLIPALAGVAASFEDMDTGSFISGLAGIPASADALGSAFGTAAEGARGLFDVLAGIATLRPDQVGAGFPSLFDALGDINDPFIANDAIQTLIATLQTGIGPAASLDATLVDLADSVSGLSVDSFEQLANQLVAMSVAAGASPRELRQLADVLQVFGEDAGYSAAGVQILVDLLMGEWRDAQRSVETDRWNAMAAAMLNVGDAASESTPQLQNFENVVAQFDTFGINEEIESLTAAFNELPDGLDAAAAAMRNEENEIVTDFTDFLANLEDELGARAEFAANIDMLERMGLGDLAEVFREEGLDAAGALADAVANPEEAARAEGLLDQFAEQQARSFQSTFARVLEESPLNLTIPLNVVGAIQNLQIQGVPGQDAAQIVGAAGAGPNVGGGVTVNQNFYTEPTPSTSTARAAQQVNAIVSAPAVN